MQTEPFVLCHDVFKIFRQADLEVVALRGLDLEVKKGEVLGIIGPSGSGKTTLLNILAGLDVPSAGRVIVGNQNILALSPAELVQYRRKTVGFVWQSTSHNLLPHLTAAQNIELPQILTGLGQWERQDRARVLLEAVGLADRADDTPDMLSGGEQQRVAIAVALANAPPLLLADEPTGDLDTATADEVLRLFSHISKTFGTTVIIVSHYPRLAEYTDRVVSIRDGRTSMETVMTPTFKPSGEGPLAYLEEYLVVDRAGRLQIPQEYLERMPLGHRVKLEIENNRIILLPEKDGAQEPTPTKAQEKISQPSPQRRWSAEPFQRERTPVLSAKGLERVFLHGPREVRAVRGVNFELFPGQAIAIFGRSGSGKSTLLHLLGGLDKPTAGSVVIEGKDLWTFSDAERAILRRKTFGFVFQSFVLLPTLSAEENVEVPLLIAGVKSDQRRRRVQECLALVGLSHRARHRPYELSGGEQQRLAIARAIANEPKTILADEPTGELDTANSWAVFALLRELAFSFGVAVVVATHDELVEKAEFEIRRLEDGAFVGGVARQRTS